MKQITVLCILPGAQVMAVSAIKAVENPLTIEEAKAEFQKVTAGRSYICPIPDEVPIP